MNDEDRLTTRGLLNLSQEFIDAYNILEKNDHRITNLFHVKFYLLAHSIELAFKAYLRHRGKSIGELKNLGHNLEDIYKQLNTNYLYNLDRKSLNMIYVINGYYKEKEFEYPKIGVKNVIPIDNLAVVTSMIKDATEIQVGQEIPPNNL